MSNHEQKAQDLQHTETMDRLRDRTDELELIISSLTLFALLTLPGWLFAKVGNIFMHLSTSMVIITNVGASIFSGVCYVLAACFIVHLMARAYWVGLIGLRSAFPKGINWNKTPSLGPILRRHYQKILPSVDSVINKTDQLASSLFAVISLLTLSVLWFGTVLLVTLVITAYIGSSFGATNAGIGIGVIIMSTLLLVCPLLLYLLDAQLVARLPNLGNSRILKALISLLRRLSELAYPQRLVLPVQLTLQSNTKPFLVSLAMILGVIAIVVIGNTSTAAWRNFTISDEYVYVDDEQVQKGFRSTHYEDMPSSLDGVRGWPRVESFTTSDSYVRLFLPYQPLRDNLLVKEYCKDIETPESRSNCFRKLWNVSINEVNVAIADFVIAERADINMRGLIGLVPMAGLRPGMHEISIVHNPLANESATPVDDRYSTSSVTFTIPIAFTPPYEMPLESDSSVEGDLKN
jgi:hypothetical protein